MKQTNLYNEDVKAALAAFELPWQQLSGKNILVLGATGLIGGCLVDMLMQHEGLDYQVYAAGRNEERANRRFSAYLDSGHYHFLPFDVTAPLSVDISFDYIVDAAGGACPQLYSEDPVGVMKSNIFGVDNLLRFGLQHGLKKLVYVSSGEVYGEGDGRVFEESYSGYIDPTTVRASILRQNVLPRRFVSAMLISMALRCPSPVRVISTVRSLQRTIIVFMPSLSAMYCVARISY